MAKGHAAGPGYCPQNAAKARGKGAARDLEAAYCLTSLSETRRKSPGKRLAGGQRTCCWAAKDAGKGPLEKLLESAQTAAKASGEGAAGNLKPGYCPQNAATACGKGAARDLEAGDCLTSLSATRRKSPGKRLAGGQRTCCSAAKDAGKGLRAA